MDNIKLVYRERLDQSCQIRMTTKMLKELTRISIEKNIRRQELIRQILQQGIEHFQEKEKEVA